MSDAYQYAVWRVVPDLERGETVNAGVVLHCRTRRFIGARVAVDARRLAVLAPVLDPRAIAAHLDGLAAIAEGRPTAGPLAAEPPSDRFGWLVAPASTVVQPGPVHTGLCGGEEPEVVLDRLFARLVLPG